ncbi:hypothetical protein DYB25_003864 [Aphanomyces astaci]|uniref:Uncharacterized protein n=1 Tax=Aphanomyces astaci TaxID=112090 RepID=A0A397AZG3_APHAT|nr:hypothetical protein DYB25_003864 [Aphanomyces astaci]
MRVVVVQIRRPVDKPDKPTTKSSNKKQVPPASAQKLQVPSTSASEKVPPTSMFEFTEVTSPRTNNYFAKILWPKAQFFEFQFKGMDLSQPEDKLKFCNFLTNIQDTPLPFVRYRLKFLTYTQSHIADNNRACFAASKQSVYNVHSASNLNRLPLSKQAKYSKLLFTQYDEPIRKLANVVVEVVADVTRNNFTFTDGCGTISLDLMVELMESHLSGGDYTNVCAVQCRLPGIKGVLVVDATSPARTLRLRPSMVKLDVLSLLQHSKLRETSSATLFPLLPIVVLKTNESTADHCGYLNDQIIALLLQRGVPASEFEARTQNYIDSVKYMGLDCRYALQCYQFRGLDDSLLRTKCTQLAASSPTQQIKAVHRDVLQVQASAMASLRVSSSSTKKKERLKIPVAKSRLLLGVCDYTNTLGPGECFVQLNESGGDLVLLVGNVAVTRNPCYHPGDIRVLRAVGQCAALDHLVNVVVFSVQGSRPAADEMAGGDLDGDIFFVLWDSHLLPSPGSHPSVAFDYTEASVKGLIQQWATKAMLGPPPFKPANQRKKNTYVTMQHVVDYLVLGASTGRLVGRIDALLLQLQALPPSSNRTEWTNLLNAMFVCGIDQLSDVVDVDSMLRSIERNISRHGAASQSAPSAPHGVGPLLAYIRSLETMEKPPPALALTMFTSSVAKIDLAVDAQDFQNLAQLYLWAVLDVLSDVERQVLKESTIPDVFAAQFQPKLVRKVVALLDREKQTLRRTHDALCKREDTRALTRIRTLRSDLDVKTLKARQFKDATWGPKNDERLACARRLHEMRAHVARLVNAADIANTQQTGFFTGYISWLWGSPPPRVPTEAEKNQAQAHIQAMTNQVVQLQLNLKQIEADVETLHRGATALALEAQQTGALLMQEMANFTPAKEEDLLEFMRAFQDQMAMRDQFVHVCTTLSAAAASTNLALLNECLVAEVHMFQTKLPVYKHRASLVSHLQRPSSMLLLVVSETGSGKSTCLPQFYLTEYIARGMVTAAKRFCVVVPRRAAAKNLAKFMASMRNAAVGGGTVGYHVGTHNAAKSDRNVHRTRTLLECVSGGIILGKSISDPWFGQFSVIFVDEVHEESADLYLLLGKLKAARTHHPALKIVFMSAKVDEKRLVEYFGANDMPVETIQGRQHPVTSVHYLSEVDYMSQVIRTVVNLHMTNPVHEFPDVLVFLPRITDIEEAVARIDQEVKAGRIKNLVPLPLHGRVDDAAKDIVLKRNVHHDIAEAPPGVKMSNKCKTRTSHRHPNRPVDLPPSQPLPPLAATPPCRRRVIFATNIAEASLTIPGVGYVVDSGLEVVVSRNVFCGATVHSVGFIARTSVVQRMGRCGREGPGECTHLYSEDQQALFAQTKKASYSDLEHIVLRLVASDTNPFEFDWIEHPGKPQLRFCVDQLVRFRMIDTTSSPWRVTSVGHHASKLLRLGLDLNAVQLLLVARDSDHRFYDRAGNAQDDGSDLADKAAVVIACVEYSSLFRQCAFADMDDIDWDRPSICDNFVNLFEEYRTSGSKKEWAKRLSLPLHAFASIDRRQKDISKQVHSLGNADMVGSSSCRWSWAQCVAAAYPHTRLKLAGFNYIGPEFVMQQSTGEGMGDKSIRLSRDELSRQRLQWSAGKTYVALQVSCHAHNPSALFASFVEEIDD